MSYKGKLSKGVNQRSFRRKAAYTNAKNIVNPRKLHKGGECIR